MRGVLSGVLVGSAQGSVGPAPAPDDPGYTTLATHKATNAYVNIAALTAPDSGNFTMSTWIKLFAGQGMNLFNHDPAVNENARCEFLNSNPVSVQTVFANADYSSEFDQNSLGPDGSGGTGWQHVLMSVETDHAPGSRLFALYVNDVLFTSDFNFDTGEAFEILFSGMRLAIPSLEIGNLACDWADYQMFHGVSILTGNTISEATRRLFIDAEGKPVDPAIAADALGNPTVLLHGAAATFVVNAGTGGASTTSGAFTDAATSPSD